MGQEEPSVVDDSVLPSTLSARNLDAVAEYVKGGKVKRIVVMTGAGISTAAGIPDFRSPKTGLYSNLERLKLPHAEAVFDIAYFREHPEPFYVLAKELYPGKFHPTVSHAFIALLAKKGLLDMVFTQNIDCLERVAGVPADKIVEAHGSFANQRCIDCKKEFPDEDMKDHVMEGFVPNCVDKSCGGLVKPDIVFFGEPLPRDFNDQAFRASVADLVLIIGTSLSVYPFASLPGMVQEGKPRVLFNMERVGALGSRGDDVLQLGDCDAGIRKLADALGWRKELEQYWRGTVGDKEADRQERSQAEHGHEVEDEVHKLADDVAAVMHLHDDDEEDVESSASIAALPQEQAGGNILRTGPSPVTSPVGDASEKSDDKATTQPASEDGELGGKVLGSGGDAQRNKPTSLTEDKNNESSGEPPGQQELSLKGKS